MTPAPPPAEVRTIGRSDLDAAATTLAAAFVDDPVWEWFLPHRAPQDRRTTTVFRSLVHTHLVHDSVWMAGDAGAVAVWSPPGYHRTTWRQWLPVAVPLLRGIGWEPLRRVGPLNALDRLHPAEPHWYLALLGTHPDHQGRGLGTAAIGPALAAADATATGCWLESSKEENIPFYRRHGFEVTDTYDLRTGQGPGRAGPRLWLMWREPQPPTP